MNDTGQAFWQTTPLAEMTREQWESLCDGCGQCCLHKLEDEESEEVFYTDIACEFLNLKTCQCSDYVNRKNIEPNCMVLTPELVSRCDWLPASCAYRLLEEGKPLEQWHPLLSGKSTSVHESGVSIAGVALSAKYIHPDDYEERIIHWVK